MNNISNKILVGFHNIVSSIAPTLKESVFYKEGKLTPEEYIKAGDFLTEKCRTWKWCGASKFSNPSLPKDKQYLKTTVNSMERASDYSKKCIAKEIEGEDDWIEAEFLTDNKEENNVNKETKVIDLDEEDKNETTANTNNKTNTENAKKDIAEEFEDFCVIEEDTNKTKIRTYDVTVTYDLYYCVPRMWLIGYSEKGVPLKTEEMKEDIMEEYRNKTVTIEPHPITGINNISVHPCRHSTLLLKMIENYEKSGKKLEVDMSIIIFLKFLHSIVPTIQYDYTMDLNI